MADLTRKQREILLRPVNPNRVLVAQGQSHLPAFDVEAHLTRVFGYEGWDREIVSLWLIAEDLEHFQDKKTHEDKEGWTVTYGCKLRLTIRNPSGEVVKITDGVATGSANHLPLRGDAHDFAMKNADSYALKRCAKALGDQFGLSLYNKGSTKALVKSIVAYDQDAPEDYEKPETMGNDEREEESTEAPGAVAELQQRIEHITGQARRYIQVAFKDKNRAKTLGARWDEKAACWYIPDGIDPEPLREWFSGPSPETSALFPTEPPDEYDEPHLFDGSQAET